MDQASIQQTEGVIRNIIVEISRECLSRGTTVSEVLVAFIVKAVALDPKNNFYIDRYLTKNDVQRLITLCVKKLMTLDVPSLDTIKMQIDFDMNYADRASFLMEHKRVLNARLLPILNEICDCRARNKEELESLYRKIVSFCILKSGMGNATDITVIRETTAALQSIFPQTELANFMIQNRVPKENQLNDLNCLVVGIRLFNKDCAKECGNFDDLIGLLNEAIPQTTRNLDNELEKNSKNILACNNLLQILQNTEPPEKFPITQQFAKMIQINLHQYEIYVKIILKDVVTCAKHTESLKQKLSEILVELHNTLQNKTAIATNSVYPKFNYISELWSSIQDEMIILSVITNIFNSLNIYVENEKNMMDNSVINDYISFNFKEKPGLNVNISFDKSPFIHYDWIDIEKVKHFSNNMLQFRSFCPTTLVNEGGILKRANSNIGVLNYKCKYYAFSNADAAREFCENPDFYLSSILQIAKSNSELIQFLQLHRQYDSFSVFGSKQLDQPRHPITTNESTCQTDTHFYNSIIIKNYDWNEWELRRKAIKLVNLRKKMTHSIQTDNSNYRIDNCTQVYLPKEKSSQTMAVKSSDVPKPQVFFKGLRGTTTGEPTVIAKVDLTLDIDY
ncbi:hypothetical protein A3Q56_01171 [Intoshia linei]|uniref:Cilia- and flagella-associated protein 206 n=1 Tax=Intoshia linei TaxID=1819745 RepID=A0A177BBL9_9BILA|nr:hypothetical protein A3Q56_01171 [Intoshia linei]